MSASSRASAPRAEGGVTVYALTRLAAAMLVIGPLAVLGAVTPAATVAPSATVDFSGRGDTHRPDPGRRDGRDRATPTWRGGAGLGGRDGSRSDWT